MQRPGSRKMRLEYFFVKHMSNIFVCVSNMETGENWKNIFGTDASNLTIASCRALSYLFCAMC